MRRRVNDLHPPRGRFGRFGQRLILREGAGEADRVWVPPENDPNPTESDAAEDGEALPEIGSTMGDTGLTEAA
jgi:hypothetical protein